MYKGKEDRATAEHLRAGEECIVVGYGNSMTPKLMSGEAVIMEPVTESTILNKNDIQSISMSKYGVIVTDVAALLAFIHMVLTSSKLIWIGDAYILYAMQ